MPVGKLDRDTIGASGARGAIEALQHFLNDAAVRKDITPTLIAADGTTVELPEPLFRILRQAARILAAGQRVSISPIEREVTTQEAADVLNVSRTYLIRLLDQKKIPYLKVGTHRRVKLGDVMSFKQRRNAERLAQLNELIAETARLGDAPDIRLEDIE
jgi:excisionase family DNA binding protein